jgi:uncharacterized membrane protein YheB (UPF0754 family)
MYEEFISNNIELLLIPIISAAVGYLTNYLAVRMMFYPVKFIGIRPIFGWQGIIPSRAKEMATIQVDLLLGKLLSITDIVDKVDPDKLSKKIHRRLKQSVHSTINQVMEEYSPGIWSIMPGGAKYLIFLKVDRSLPSTVSHLIQDIQYNINEFVDLKRLVVDRVVENPEIINDVFLKVGGKEFTFIERSGFYFGFTLGLPTMFLWNYYHVWWVLVIGGLAVGYLTNWIAIHMIFEPKNPIKIGPFTIQGLFLKRQNEASRVYSKIIEERLVNTQTLMDTIIKGDQFEQLTEIVNLHVDKAIDENLNLFKPYTSAYIGPDDYYEIKNKIVQRLLKEAGVIFSYGHEYTTNAIAIADELTEKMQNLSSEEFENVIRPAYQADEWKLITVGGVIGMGAGYCQLLILSPSLAPEFLTLLVNSILT